MAPSQSPIAIIGAGISGLSLAIALARQGLPCVIYEAREAPLDIGGSIIFSPNGIKVFKALDLYEDLKEVSFEFDSFPQQDGKTGKIVESISYRNGEHCGLRVYRRVLIKLLLARVLKLNILVHFNRKYSHVIDENGVEFAFTDGTIASASFLIAADGIRSAVRKHIDPAQAQDTGVAGVAASIPTSQLGLPPLEDMRSLSNQHPLPVGIGHPAHGLFIIAPQTASGDECMVLVTRRVQDESNDPLAMLRAGSEDYPAVVQNAVREIDPATAYIWRFQQLPVLKSWISVRVVLVGDAAHAIPPSSGQGANAALEDVYSLALTLAKSMDMDALKKWQAFRQERVASLLILNERFLAKRLPLREGATEEERWAKTASLQPYLDKVYELDVEKAVDQYLR